LRFFYNVVAGLVVFVFVLVLVCMMKYNAGGICSEVDVGYVPRKVFEAITSEGTVTGRESTDCSDAEVFVVRVGSGYAQKYEDYAEMNIANVENSILNLLREDSCVFFTKHLF
jgi:hypothetical protein